MSEKKNITPQPKPSNPAGQPKPSKPGSKNREINESQKSGTRSVGPRDKK